MEFGYLSEIANFKIFLTLYDATLFVSIVDAQRNPRTLHYTF